jgi:hypothetical protein
MRLQDYSLSAEFYSGYNKRASMLFIEPLVLDLSRLTQIYLIYHGFTFARMYADYNYNLHLTFDHNPGPLEFPITSHTVQIENPIHIADIRFSVIPELIRAFNNYDIHKGDEILPQVVDIYRIMRNEYQ